MMDIIIDYSQITNVIGSITPFPLDPIVSVTYWDFDDDDGN